MKLAVLTKTARQLGEILFNALSFPRHLLGERRLAFVLKPVRAGDVFDMNKITHWHQ